VEFGSPRHGSHARNRNQTGTVSASTSSISSQIKSRMVVPRR